ncbi:MAG: phosphonate C-P lyase system protein PhnL [Rhizobiaceae bacterium]
MPGDQILRLRDVGKSFTMHLRDGVELPVFAGVELDVAEGECVVLAGPSGIGKSSILKMVYGNYRTDAGSIEINAAGAWVAVSSDAPRTVLRLRQSVVGYVSQFLQVIPRVGTLDIVAGAAIQQGDEPEAAARRACEMLERLNVPSKLWNLPPATFSGGEQQRVNVARGFIADYPLLLLDEPTASLDAVNSAVVAELIDEKKARGVAMLGIFHDQDIRARVADRLVDVTRFAREAAA